jgi:ribose/xylose/arabinose/galactoside ABC-type transport system permease subunit
MHEQTIMKEKNLMTAPQSTTVAESSVWRDARDIARYDRRNRWVLVALVAVVLVAGIGLNWAWLVAPGIVPILLSTLPCLIMCGLGLCILCRSGEKQTAARDTADAATSSAALGIAKMDNASVDRSDLSSRAGREQGGAAT